MMTRSLTLIATFISFSISAQTLPADDAFRKADYSKALELYDRLARENLKEDAKEPYVLCNLRMSECKIYLGQPDEGRRMAENICNYLKEYLPNHPELLGQALTMQGKSYMQLGRTDLALEKLLEAQKVLPDGSLEQSGCFNELGVVYWNQAQYDLAKQYLEKALSIRQKHLRATDPLVGDTYNNLGLVNLEDDPLQALIFYSRALNIYESNLGEKHPKVVTGLSNLAFANAQLEDYDEAVSQIERGMEILDGIYDGSHPTKALFLNALGRIQTQQGRFNLALVTHATALKMLVELFGERHPEVANTHFLLAEAHKGMDDFEASATSYQAGIYANLLDQNYNSLYDLPEIRDFFNADILLSCLQGKAIALEAQHFQKTLNVRDLKGSLDALVLCDDLISRIRQTRQNESDKIRLGNTAKDVYSRGISLALLLSERSIKRKDYLEQAFEFSERSKSAVLLEAITETRAKQFAGIPVSVIEEEDSLKAEIAFFEQQLAAGNGDQERLKGLLFKYQSAYRNYIDELENNYPRYYELKYSSQLTTITDLQDKLDDETTALSYFKPDSSLLYIFMVTNSQARAYTIQLQDDLDKLVTGLRNSIKFQMDDAVNDIAGKLYTALIPTRLKTPKLVIFPDGILGTMPFEVLMDPKSKTDRFMIEDFAISYDYSATLFAGVGDEPTTPGNGILLYAPVDFEKNDTPMTSLPDTEKEVEEIRLLFGESKDADVFIGDDASEERFKSGDLSNYQFLHFATHGLVNESQPQLSRIFLRPGEKEDGSLYAGEIYNLKLNADLVTLSACETGLGKLAKGEGIVGLSRALQYAGARNLIVSLWPVADESTSDLMIKFYDVELHNNYKGYGTALRRAKLHLLSSKAYRSPYYWAPFILVGY